MSRTSPLPLDDKKVAIIIPTFKSEDTLARAINSALAQQLPEMWQLDVIVVDDCSPDGTGALAEALAKADPRLRYFRQAQNTGAAQARNRALQETDAAWFTPLDSDDYMHPGRLKGLIAVVQTGAFDVIADNLLVGDEHDPNTTVRCLWPDKPPGEIELTFELFVRQNLQSAAARSELGYLKPLIYRGLFRADEAPYQCDMRFGEDYELYTRLLARGARACLIDPLGYVQVPQANSLSRSQKTLDFARLVRTDKALLERPDISSAERAVLLQHFQETTQEWMWLRTIDAFRARDIRGFLNNFCQSWQTNKYLLGKLISEFQRRMQR